MIARKLMHRPPLAAFFWRLSSSIRARSLLASHVGAPFRARFHFVGA